MIEKIRDNKVLQIGLAIVFGFIFGFLLQKGGVTEYDILIGQLLLTDFTVVKVILTAAKPPDYADISSRTDGGLAPSQLPRFRSLRSVRVAPHSRTSTANTCHMYGFR